MLRKNFKKVFVKVLRYSGLPFIIRKLIQRRKVTIVYYHNIDATAFNRHLTLLAQYYNIIGLQAFINGETKNIKSRLIITFDDGHVGNFDLLPVLKKHHIPITVFLTSGLVGSNRHFWFLLDGLSSKTKRLLKKMKDEDRLFYLAEKHFYNDTKKYNYPQALSVDQIKQMAEFVDFQSHTVTHPCLPMCSNEKAMEEIRMSKVLLEKLLNKGVNCIAFPNNDYGDREIKFCLDAGYKGIFTANLGFNRDDRKCHLFNRLSTNDTKNLDELILRVTGIWKVLQGIFKSP